MGPNLVEEQQIIASNAIQKNVKKDTIFIPQKIQVYGMIDKKRFDYVELEFKEEIPHKIQFIHSLKKKNKIEFRLGYDLIDFQGKIALSQKNADDYISYLPVIGNPIPVQPKNNNLKITLDFDEKVIVMG